jgi:hypothetical protein
LILNISFLYISIYLYIYIYIYIYIFEGTWYNMKIIYIWLSRYSTLHNMLAQQKHRSTRTYLYINIHIDMILLSSSAAVTFSCVRRISDGREIDLSLGDF